MVNVVVGLERPPDGVPETLVLEKVALSAQQQADIATAVVAGLCGGSS
jgi:hypothetical protein